MRSADVGISVPGQKKLIDSGFGNSFSSTANVIPRERREAEVTQFANHLAVQRKVAAATQTQALNAIAFLYRDVLVVPLGEMNGLNRGQQRKRIPPGCGSRGDLEACNRPYTGTFVCYTTPRVGDGHPDHSTLAETPKPPDHLMLCETLGLIAV
jgi:hypothetical protein